jgi:hypothetical protein
MINHKVLYIECKGLIIIRRKTVSGRAAEHERDPAI